MVLNSDSINPFAASAYIYFASSGYLGIPAFVEVNTNPVLFSKVDPPRASKSLIFSRKSSFFFCLSLLSIVGS